MDVNVIDSYQFGLIVINGKQYTSDTIILPDSIRDTWWRKVGHELCLKDIAEFIAEKPEVLLVGTGASGQMGVLPEVQQAAEANGIELIVESTDKACQTYNQLCHSKRTVAALHLTC